MPALSSNLLKHLKQSSWMFWKRQKARIGVKSSKLYKIISSCSTKLFEIVESYTKSEASFAHRVNSST